MIISIHQPNFFPWLGFFNKIEKSDIFILLDNVQFQKKGGSWTNRVKLLIGDEPRWVTASINRDYHGIKNINEMSFVLNDNWRAKFLSSIRINYKKHPFYDDVINILEPLILNSESNVAEYNIESVMNISSKLGLDLKKFRRSSNVEINLKSNELLCKLTQHFGGSIYMCGGGADGYQDQKVFDENKIQLIPQNYSHPKYSQYNNSNFIPGLSIIDALMNLGWKGVGDLIKS